MSSRRVLRNEQDPAARRPRSAGQASVSGGHEGQLKAVPNIEDLV